MPQTDDKHKKPTLSDKQRRFIDEYLVDSNATGAARRAGYGEKSAASVGCRLLKDPQIAAELKRRQTAISNKLGMDAEFVRKRWRELIETCSQKVMAERKWGPIMKPDGTQAEEMLDAATVRGTLHDVAAHLQMFEKPEEPPKEDGNTGVLMSPGVASREDWDNG